MKRILLPFCLAALGFTGHAADPAPAPAATPSATPAATPHQVPPPTVADLAYGSHPKQVMDMLRFDRFTIGWAIQYRFTSDAVAEGHWPPVEWPLRDAARALQLVRSKAAEWNIDKKRIGATGGSAGACSSLWLAFHDDMAEPNSSDPIAHESTRLWCAAVNAPQTTLDPQQMKEWTPNSNYGGHAFGFVADPKQKLTAFAAFLAGREKVLPWIKEYSPYEHVSSDDPPIYMLFKAPPALGQDQQDPTHTANFGVKLQEHCKEKGVPCELVYPGAPDVKHATTEAFLIETLKK